MLNKNYTRENNKLIEVLREYSSDLSKMSKEETDTVKMFLTTIRVIIRSGGKSGVVLNHKLSSLLIYLNSII